MDSLCQEFFIDRSIRTELDLARSLSASTGVASQQALYTLAVDAYMHVLNLISRLQETADKGQPGTRGTKRGRCPGPASPAPKRRCAESPLTDGDPDPAEEAGGDDSSSGGTGEPEDLDLTDSAPFAAWSRGAALHTGSRMPGKALPRVAGRAGAGSGPPPCPSPCSDEGSESPRSDTTENPDSVLLPRPLSTDVPVLPGGGGRVLKVSRAHLPFLIVLARLQYTHIQHMGRRA